MVAALVAGTMATASATTRAAEEPTLKAHGSARQVYVTGVADGARLALLRDGEHVRTKRATALGGAVFYKVKPGDGYRVRLLPDGPTSKAVTVHTNAAKQWNPKIYEQSIKPGGYGYLTTRDGTKLAYSVHLPTSPAGRGLPGPIVPPDGLPAWGPPYPTLIEYSGYGYARPSGPQSGIAVLANLMGFAVVDVNMRGTGCSGGAFNFFEPLQNLDGYDVIETVARQPWVKGGKVGMMGISYGGISQLFTAQLRPPSLSAIAPLSVIDATATTLYPGGVRNDGFAVNWAKERQHEAMPAGPDAGQPWAWERIQEGDKVCERNQALHGEAQDLLQTIRENDHYRPEVADPLDPVTFVHKIDVPVFMACQWQDEQTGGHCPTLAANMTGTKKKWFTFTNGPHIDSLAPDTYNRWYDFLNIYVAKQAPSQNAAVTQAAAPVIFQGAMGLPQDDVVTLPFDPIQAMPTYELAKEAFEALPSIRVLFDMGAGDNPSGDNRDGNPYAAFEESFDRWPIPSTDTKRWYLRASKGRLRSAKPLNRHVARFTADADALPLTNYGENTGTGGLWGEASQWDWQWEQNPDGTAASFVTAPLKKDTAVVGAGAAYLWVRSSTPDVDLQATVSEVRPDGKETFVQNGYIRASMRKLSHSRNNLMHTPSTGLEPVPSMLKSDDKPMPKGRFVRVPVPLYYQGHVYREGTRIRITIAAPNGAQPIWSFRHTAPTDATSKVAILSSAQRTSRLVLPVIPGVEAGSDQPPCPSLRNQPCRDYQRIVNH